MAELRRSEERVKAQLPVRMDGEENAWTRDICPSGVFLETELALQPGNPIAFSIEFESPQGRLRLECKGEVARVEQGPAKRGLAARILESRWCHEQVPAAVQKTNLGAHI